MKDAVQNQDATAVFMGSAYKNKGVQPLLDAIVRYLPSPLAHEVTAKKWDNPEEKIPLAADPAKPFVGMAFKLVDDPYGQLTFMRIYQGTVKKGDQMVNQRTSQRQRFSRIVRMHADKREEIDSASAGDIVAIIGVDAASGDTYAAEHKFCTLESMFVAEPVIKMAINAAQSRGFGDKLAKALQRFSREDPTFRVTTDEETGETLIAGMGELHLDIYVERIRREYKVEVEVGAPKVSYREAPTASGRVQLQAQKANRRLGPVRPHRRQASNRLPEDAPEPFEFENNVIQGRIPKEYIPSVEKGFRAVLNKGPIAGFPIVGIKAILDDGSYHEVDSSDMAFQICGAELLPRNIPANQAGAVGTGDEGGNRSANHVPRSGGRQPDQPPRHDYVVRSSRQHGRDRRRSAAGRNVRLLDRPAQHDARARHVQHGVLPSTAACPSAIQQEIIEEKKKQLVGAK